MFMKRDFSHLVKRSILKQVTLFFLDLLFPNPYNKGIRLNVLLPFS